MCAFVIFAPSEVRGDPAAAVESGVSMGRLISLSLSLKCSTHQIGPGARVFYNGRRNEGLACADPLLRSQQPTQTSTRTRSKLAPLQCFAFDV